MGTRQSTVDFVLDQLAGLADVRAQKMFGEYAIYYDEKVVGLVCDDQLFIKITPAGKALVGDAFEEGEAYPGAKPSLLVGPDHLEDGQRLCELVRVTANALPTPGPRAAKKTKAANKKRAKKRQASSR
jgi:TfoX/Sxy family transcriptional regulator of competence genes